MSKQPNVIGIGLQNMATRKKGKLKKRQTALPGKTLSLRATAQVFYKYNSADGDEEACSTEYSFSRCTANSKAMTASWAEEVAIECNTPRRHHLSIVIRIDADKYGRVCEIALHGHKYIKDNDDGELTFRESRKYKTSEDDRNPELSARWYNGLVGFAIQAQGNISGKGAVPPGTGGSSKNSKVAPSGNPSDPLIFKLTLKSIMQAPQAASTDPADMKRERQRSAAARRQVCYALLTILIFLASGAVFFPLVEGWTVLDAIYFGMVTITTVGYGDMGPVTVEGRIFTSIYVMGGVGIIGVAVGIVGGYVMEQNEKISKALIKKAQSMALADQDTESSDSEDDIAGKKRGRASRDLLILQQRFDKSPLGCLSRFVKKWLKIFMPVIIVLGIGMAVMMTSEIDPQITICEGVPGEDTSLCLFDNQTYTMTFVNGIYWGLVTGTTVGYGDISPTTDGNKIFCCFFLVFAVITTANALSTVGDALMSAPGEDQIGQILDKKLDAEFLMSLDMDGSGDVTEYEYLAAMLIRLNHVDEDQIDSIMKAFRKLDVDGSGALSVEDLKSNLKSEKKKKKMESVDQDVAVGEGFIPTIPSGIPPPVSPTAAAEASKEEAAPEDVIRDAEKALAE